MSMTIQQAIENRERCLKYLEGCAVGTNPESVEAVRLSLEALREKAEREDPKPLTLEELRQMDGEPVYLEYQLGQHTYTGWNVLKSVFLTEKGDYLKCIDGKLFSVVGMERVKFITEQSFATQDYGKTWIAYRHKPKEV